MQKTSNVVEMPLTPRTRAVAERAGLTAQPCAEGWSTPARPAETLPPRAARTAKKAGRTRIRPAMLPVGWRKAWRFGVGLFNMLARPVVMRDYPIHLQLESTDACNRNGRRSSRDVVVRKASLLRTPQWQDIIDELRPCKVDVSGTGEPFLHPEIYDIVAYAKSRGASVNCSTGFARVHDDHRKLIECGIDQLRVSIDATDAGTFRLIRGEDAWDAIVENIRQVNYWKKVLGSRTPSIRLDFAVQGVNYRQCVRLVELARQLGADVLHYHPCGSGFSREWENMSKSELRRQIDESDRRARDYDIETNLSAWQHDFEHLWNRWQHAGEVRSEPGTCRLPWTGTWLGADGWVRPCPVMSRTSDEGRMGHISRQSFAEIWNNDKYRELREALKRGERPTRSCKTCYPKALGDVVDVKSKLLLR